MPNEAERHILFKLKPAIADQAVADGSDVENDSTTQSGILSTAAHQQDVNNRIDATGIGRQITTFTGSISMTTFNQNVWYGGRQRVFLETERGQGNAVRTATLPNPTALAAIFDDLASKNVGETYVVTFIHSAGTSSAINRNALTVRNPTVSALFNRNEIPVTIGRGASVTFRISRVGGTIGTWERLSVEQSTDPVATFGEVAIQNTSWNNRNGSFLPSSDSVQKGYAFPVIGSSPNDGTLRQGLLDAGVSDRVIYDGDYVVWTADAFTAWSNGDDWFVLDRDSLQRISRESSNFLSTVTEFDNRVDLGFAEDLGASDALVWLSPAPFLRAPFLNPSSDTGGAPDGNPRPSQTIEYIGGRENRNADDQFQFGSNFFGAYLYVGISPNFITNHGVENIDIVMRDVDSGDISRFNLDSQFSIVDDETFTNSTVIHYAYNPRQIANTVSTVNYISLETIEIILTETQRHFTLDASKVDVTGNIPSGSLEESKFSADVVAKLDANHETTPEDDAKLSGLETTTSQTAIQDSYSFLFRYGNPSNRESDYFTKTLSDGIIPEFTNRPVTLLVDKNVSITGITRSSDLALSGNYLNKKAYTATILSATVDNPLDQISVITGTIDTIELSGAQPSFKVDPDNLSNELANQINQHDTFSLPAPLQALNNGARVETFNNTNFTSNSSHVEAGRTFAVLKNEPDGTDGTPTYPISSGDFINEITNSELTLTPPTDLSSVYIPRIVSGELDNGVDVFTGGAMTGAGIVNDTFEVNTEDDANHRLVFGFWFDKGQSTARTTLLDVKVRDSASFLPLLEVTENNVLVARRLTSSGGTTSSTVTHTLYGVDGVLTHTFAGVAVQEEQWRVSTARTYTINARLIANGNDEGSTTLDYTISDINTSQGVTTHTLTFSTASGNHTQDITVSYAAQTTLYGGEGHTLRVGIDQLADNVNFDIDHILMSITYDTVETTTTSPTYGDIAVNEGSQVVTNRLHKLIGVIEPVNGTIDGNINLKLAFGGYDANENFTIFDENDIDLSYPASDLDYGTIRFGGGGVVMQNVQGYFLNADTPVAEFPRHSQLHDYMLHHDDKQSDYLWNVLDAPDMDVESVVFSEFVTFTNLILDNTDGTKRWRLVVKEDGSVITQEVV